MREEAEMLVVGVRGRGLGATARPERGQAKAARLRVGVATPLLFFSTDKDTCKH